MKTQFNKFSLSAIFSMIFGLSARQTDHERLTRHIVALNQKNSLEEIIAEVALCLKEILHYRLFAFALQKKKGIDVWLTPRMYRTSLEATIEKDFKNKAQEGICYMNHCFHDEDTELQFNMSNLISFDLSEDACQAKIYIMSDRPMLGYHKEMMDIILKSCGIAMARQMDIARLTNAAALDPLTGCYNRREFENQTQRSIAAATRHKSELSVIMLDIDHFKQVNDTYGHLAGDQVLKTLVTIVQQNMRTDDILARYGGEEFIAVLPKTCKQEAMELADRLRQIIQESPVQTETGSIRVTASFGVATHIPHTDINRLIQDADAMLYKAKRNGRNTVMPGLMKICKNVSPKLDGPLQKLIANQIPT